MDRDPATLKFERALPFALLPLSPQLAALHTARTRVNTQSSCTRCGSDLTLHTRVVRSKHNACAISTACSACGNVTVTPVEKGAVDDFSSRKPKAISKVHDPPVPITPVPLPISVSVQGISMQPDSVSHVTSSSTKHVAPSETRTPGKGVPPQVKKKSGLQQMLQRNREKEKNRAKTAEAKPTGLSDFLSTL